MAEPLIDLWLDDLREPEVVPPLDHPIMWVKTAAHAIESLAKGNVRWASLDHDLGITEIRDCNGHTGCTVVQWMASHRTWPLEGIIVHSWNPDGVDDMCAIINEHSPHRAIRREAHSTGWAEFPQRVSREEWDEYIQRMNLSHD